MTKAYQERILEYVRSTRRPVTTEEVAKALDISWQTAQLHLLNLAHQDRINFRKIGRQNIFTKRGSKTEKNEYRNLFDQNPQPNIIFDRETLELLAINDAFANLSGFSREELVGMKATYLLANGQDRELLALRVHRKRGFEDLPDGRAYRTLGIWNLMRKDGHPFLCEMMARPLQFEGRIASFVIAQPMQQTKPPELHPQEARFPLAAVLPAMLWTAKPDGVIDFANQRWYEYTGLSHAQTRENPWPLLIHHEERSRWQEMVKQSKSTGQPFEGEFRLLRADGEYRQHLVRVTPIKDEKGRITLWAGSMMDVHAHRAAEQQLRESEERFRHTFEQAAAGIAHLNIDGRWMRANERFVQIVGYPAEELTKLTFKDITHPEDRKADLEQAQRLLDGEIASYRMEKRYVRKDGSIVWTTLNRSLKRKEDGTPDYFISVVEDITERKKAERELKFQKHALDKSSIVAITDANGTITYVNDKFCEISGYEREELIGKNHRILNSGLHPREFFREMYRTIIRGDVWCGEIRNRRKDGSFYWVDTIIVPSIGPNGLPEQYVAIRNDVTSRKRVEDELRHTAAELSEQHSQLTAVLNSLQDGVVVFDMWGKAVIINDAWARIWNYPSAVEMMADTEYFASNFKVYRLDGSLLPVEEWPVSKVLRGEMFKNWTLKAVRTDIGREGIFSFSGEPVYDEDGKQILAVTVTTDITENFRAHQELEESNRRLEIAQTASNSFTFEWDLKTGHMDVSGDPAVIYGRSYEELTDNYEAWGAHVHPQDREEVTPRVFSLIERLESYTIEVRIIQPDGGHKWAHIRARPIADEHGKPAKVVGLMMDVTQKRIADEEFQRSRDQLNIILQGVRDGITATTPDGRIIYANQTAARLCGFSSVEDLVSSTPLQVMKNFEILDGNGRPMRLDEMGSRRALQGEVIHDQLVQFRIKATGEERWSLVSSEPVYNDEGNVRFVINIFRDITEERTSERRRAEDVRRAKFIGETLNDISQSLDYEPRLVALAQNAVPQLADWCAIDMIDDTHELHRLAVVHVDPTKIRFAERLRELQPFNYDAPTGLGKVLRTGQPDITLDITREMVENAIPPGELRDIVNDLELSSIIVIPLIARGKVLGAITLAMAESRRKYTVEDVKFVEEVAHRAAIAIDNARLYRDAQQALALRDDFLSIASHELKTPVTSIKAFLQALERRMERPVDFDFSKNLQYMRLSVKQVDRLGAIINDLLDINRITKGKMEYHFKTLSIGPIVADAVERMGVSFPTHHLNLKLQDLTTKVRVDELRFEQVLTNLITNAAKYSPEGSGIDIITRTDGKNVYIDVKDQGIGISETDQEMIFERYYRSPHAVSTRAGGLGVGLFISYELIKAHGGKITVSSRVSEGSTFTIVLPCAEGC